MHGIVVHREGIVSCFDDSFFAAKIQKRKELSCEKSVLEAHP